MSNNNTRIAATDDLNLGQDSRMAKAVVWAMVATHPGWLFPPNPQSEELSVPYNKIDTYLKLTSGTSEKIWTMARASACFQTIAKLFETTFPVGASKQPTFPVASPQQQTWPGGQCGHVADFLQLLDRTVDPACVGDVQTIPK